MILLVAALVAQGLTLRDLQDRARNNDPRARQAVAQLENARGRSDEASWAFFPDFSTTAYLAGPTPERRLKDPNGNPVDPANLTPGTTGDWWKGKLGVTTHAEMQAILPVWTFGKLTAGRSAGEHLVKATEALLQRARDQAAFDTARAYWGYQTARNADTSVQKIRDRLAEAKTTAQKLLAQQSDQISKADSLKLDYLSEEIEAKHAEAVKNRDLALTGLKLLVGLQDLNVAQQDLPEAPALPNGDEILRKALERRPETHAAAEAVRARQDLVDLARARFWPDLALVGGLRFTTTTNADNPPSPFVNNPYHEGSAAGPDRSGCTGRTSRRSWHGCDRPRPIYTRPSPCGRAPTRWCGSRCSRRCRIWPRPACAPSATSSRRPSASSSRRRRASLSIQAWERRASCSRTRCSTRAPTASG